MRKVDRFGRIEEGKEGGRMCWRGRQDDSVCEGVVERFMKAFMKVFMIDCFRNWVHQILTGSSNQ